MPAETDWQRIRNRFHVYGNPIGVPKMERVFDLLDLPATARVLDVGCGKGEVLIRLAERFDARTVGVDPSPVLTMARAAAAKRVPNGDLVWHDAKIEDVTLAPASFDVTVCIGSSHAFGTYEDMLDGLIPLTRPGGLILVGEGFWLREPDPQYLAALGGDPDWTLHDNSGNMEVAESKGLLTLYNTISSRDEWDDFEWLYRYAMERHRHEHGFTPEQEEKFAATCRFRDIQERWGRSTMGFALYLFRGPGEG